MPDNKDADRDQKVGELLHPDLGSHGFKRKSARLLVERFDRLKAIEFHMRRAINYLLDDRCDVHEGQSSLEEGSDCDFICRVQSDAVRMTRAKRIHS